MSAALDERHWHPSAAHEGRRYVSLRTILDSMPLFERHVFVCQNQRPPGHPKGCCKDKGSVEIRELMKAAVARHGLKGRVRVNEAGCLDQCEHGVTIVVYPDAVWYGFVRAEDVEEIVTSHLVAGKPVERLRLDESCINTSTCKHRPRT